MRLLRRRLVLAAPWLLLSVVGCGGAVDLAEDGFGAGSGDGWSSSSSDASAPSRLPAPSSGGFAEDAGAPEESSDAEARGGSSGGVSTSADASAPAPGSSGSSSFPPEGYVKCGEQLACAAGAQTCCFDPNGSTRACVASAPSGPGTCPAPSVALGCARSSDCAGGKVCCGYVHWSEEAAGYTQSTCKDSCDESGGADWFESQLCDPNAAVDECASQMGRCAPSYTMPGYFGCAWAP